MKSVAAESGTVFIEAQEIFGSASCRRLEASAASKVLRGAPMYAPQSSAAARTSRCAYGASPSIVTPQ